MLDTWGSDSPRLLTCTLLSMWCCWRGGGFAPPGRDPHVGLSRTAFKKKILEFPLYYVIIPILFTCEDVVQLTPDGSKCVIREDFKEVQLYSDWMSGRASFRDLSMAASSSKTLYPGGSRERVNRAGNAVRDGSAKFNDHVTIDTWRASHRHVLNTWQSILRNRTRGTGIIVAQRHKRIRTIVDKLVRYPKMQLSRMDDVAGCRLIFADKDALYEFRKTLHGARFRHLRKSDIDKYDYIKAPKNTGYRGVHDVYSYNANSPEGQRYKGLLTEIQYRTLHQHAWATCVEVVGFLTESQPKFERGDHRYQDILCYASEIIARSFEGEKSSYSELSDADVVAGFLRLDTELKFMPMLRNLNSATSEITKRKNVILMFSSTDDLEVRTFEHATDALKALFELEQANPDKDVVLVKADTSEEVRIAFKNYFSDATDFIDLIDRGCEKLVPSKVRYFPAG